MRLTPNPTARLSKRTMDARVKEHLGDRSPNCASATEVREAMDDRERWNQRYRDGSHRGAGPHPWAVEVADALPRRGRALDLAGGVGALAIWLAQRGLEVTLADVSEVALDLARERASGSGVSLHLSQVDLMNRAELDALGDGWSLVCCTNYFQPDVFSWIAQRLLPGGLLLFAQPSLQNLERHARPSARFLVDPLRLDPLLNGLLVLERFEGWTPGGIHELRLLARKASNLWTR